MGWAGRGLVVVVAGILTGVYFLTKGSEEQEPDGSSVKLKMYARSSRAPGKAGYLGPSGSGFDTK